MYQEQYGGQPYYGVLLCKLPHVCVACAARWIAPHAVDVCSGKMDCQGYVFNSTAHCEARPRTSCIRMHDQWWAAPVDCAASGLQQASAPAVTVLMPRLEDQIAHGGGVDGRNVKKVCEKQSGALAELD